jgi:hypothetical protein
MYIPPPCPWTWTGAAAHLRLIHTFCIALQALPDRHYAFSVPTLVTLAMSAGLASAVNLPSTACWNL